MVSLNKIWLNQTNILVDSIKFGLNQLKILIHLTKWLGYTKYFVCLFLKLQNGYIQNYRLIWLKNLFSATKDVLFGYDLVK